jgi:hypothetical protein
MREMEMGGGFTASHLFSFTHLGRGVASLSASAFCRGTAKEEPTELLGYDEYCTHFAANRD